MDDNPYRPSVPALPPGDGTELLASPGARLAAALIDALVVGIVDGIVLWHLGLLDALMRRSDDVGLLAETTALGFALWVAVQILFLAQGQTLGKRICDLRMVDNATGGPVSLGRLILARYLPVHLVGIIPILGRLLLLVDVLFIFNADRRCVHDHIAGTKVVKA